MYNGTWYSCIIMQYHTPISLEVTEHTKFIKISWKICEYMKSYTHVNPEEWAFIVVIALSDRFVPSISITSDNIWQLRATKYISYNNFHSPLSYFSPSIYTTHNQSKLDHHQLIFHRQHKIIHDGPITCHFQCSRSNCSRKFVYNKRENLCNASSPKNRNCYGSHHCLLSPTKGRVDKK